MTGGQLDGFVGRFVRAEGEHRARVSVVMFGAATEFVVALGDLQVTSEQPPAPRVVMTLPDGTDDFVQRRRRSRRY